MSIHWTWLATPKSAACASARGDHACVLAAGMLWLVLATMLVSSLLVSTSIRVLELPRDRLHRPASMPHHGSPQMRRKRHARAASGC